MFMIYFLCVYFLLLFRYALAPIIFENNTRQTLTCSCYTFTTCLLCADSVFGVYTLGCFVNTYGTVSVCAECLPRVSSWRTLWRTQLSRTWQHRGSDYEWGRSRDPTRAGWRILAGAPREKMVPSPLHLNTHELL